MEAETESGAASRGHGAARDTGDREGQVRRGGPAPPHRPELSPRLRRQYALATLLLALCDPRLSGPTRTPALCWAFDEDSEAGGGGASPGRCSGQWACSQGNSPS